MAEGAMRLKGDGLILLKDSAVMEQCVKLFKIYFTDTTNIVSVLTCIGMFFLH